VARAAATCGSRYLDAILSLAKAVVVVVVGMQAQSLLKTRIPELPDPPYIYSSELGGRPRELVFIWPPAPFKGPKTIAGLYGAERLQRLQRLAAHELPSNR
jgi:hypothetical protein